jgi:hypothetical protein
MDAFLSWMAIYSGELQTAGSAFGLSITATSTTSLTVGTGSQSLTIGTDKGFIPGMEVVLAYTATPTTRMAGTVTSYNATTGALVVNVTSVQGSGTIAAWSIGPAAMVSFDGQTYTDLRLAGKITETAYALTGTLIDPANGSIQTKTLAANTTFTEALSDGNSVVLILTAGAYTVTWPTTIWLWGAAPTLSPTGKSHVVLYQVAGVLYGVLAGTSA